MQSEKLKVKGWLQQSLAAFFVLFVLSTTSVQAASLNVDQNNPACDDVSGAPYCKIQPAIDAANPGDVIRVAAGVYKEQLDIAINHLTIKGSGRGKTIVKSRKVLATKFTTSQPNKPIIYVHDASGVAIRDLTVNGAGRANGNYRMSGIAFYNAGGSVLKSAILNVRETPLSGAQHGVALYAYVDDGTPRRLTVRNNIIREYQKNGMALNGEGLTVTVVKNKVMGAGALSFMAQNGIQLGWGATGQVVKNTVKNHDYTGDDVTATGILVYDSEGVTLVDNKLHNNETGIYLYAEGGSDGNRVVNNRIIGTTEWDAIVVVGSKNQVVNNYVKGNGTNEAGIWIEGDRNNVVNNKIDANDIGIWVESGDKNRLIHNKITNSATQDIKDLGTNTLII